MASIGKITDGFNRTISALEMTRDDMAQLLTANVKKVAMPGGKGRPASGPKDELVELMKELVDSDLGKEIEDVKKLIKKAVDALSDYNKRDTKTQQKDPSDPIKDVSESIRKALSNNSAGTIRPTEAMLTKVTNELKGINSTLLKGLSRISAELAMISGREINVNIDRDTFVDRVAAKSGAKSTAKDVPDPKTNLPGTSGVKYDWNDYFSRISGKLGEGVVESFGVFVDEAKGFGKGLAKPFVWFFESVKEDFSKGQLGIDLADIGKDIKKGLAWTGNLIATPFTSMYATIKMDLEAGNGELVKEFKETWGTIKGKFKSFVSPITTWFDFSDGKLLKDLKDTGRDIKNLGKAIASPFVDWFEDIKTNVNELELVQGLKETWGTIKDGFKSRFKDVMTWFNIKDNNKDLVEMGQHFKSVGQTIAKGAKWLASGAKKVVSPITGFFGGIGRILKPIASKTIEAGAEALKGPNKVSATNVGDLANGGVPTIMEDVKEIKATVEEPKAKQARGKGGDFCVCFAHEINRLMRHMTRLWGHGAPIRQAAEKAEDETDKPLPMMERLKQWLRPTGKDGKALTIMERLKKLLKPEPKSKKEKEWTDTTDKNYQDWVFRNSRTKKFTDIGTAMMDERPVQALMREVNVGILTGNIIKGIGNTVGMIGNALNKAGPIGRFFGGFLKFIPIIGHYLGDIAQDIINFLIKPLEEQMNYFQNLRQTSFETEGIVKPEGVGMAGAAAGVNAQEAMLARYQITQQDVAIAGQGLGAIQTQQEKNRRRGIRDAHVLNRVTMTGLGISRMLGANAQETADLFADLNQNFQMTTHDLSTMGLGMRQIARDTGLTGDNLVRVVRSSEQFMRNMRNSGSLTAGAGVNITRLGAEAATTGTSEGMNRILGELSRNMLTSGGDDRTRNLLFSAAGGNARLMEQLMNNTLLQNRSGMNEMAAGMERTMMGFTGGRAVSSLNANERTRVDAALQSAYGMGINELQILIQNFRRAGRSFVQQLGELDTQLTDQGRTVGQRAQSQELRDSLVNTQAMTYLNQFANALENATPNVQGVNAALGVFSGNMSQAGSTFAADMQAMGNVPINGGQLNRDTIRGMLNQMLPALNRRMKTAGMQDQVIKPEDIEKALAGDPAGIRNLITQISRLNEEADQKIKANQDPISRIERLLTGFEAVIKDFVNKILVNGGKVVDFVGNAFQSSGLFRNIQNLMNGSGSWSTVWTSLREGIANFDTVADDMYRQIDAMPGGPDGVSDFEKSLMKAVVWVIQMLAKFADAVITVGNWIMNNLWPALRDMVPVIRDVIAALGWLISPITDLIGLFRGLGAASRDLEAAQRRSLELTIQLNKVVADRREIALGVGTAGRYDQAGVFTPGTGQRGFAEEVGGQSRADLLRISQERTRDANTLTEQHSTTMVRDFLRDARDVRTMHATERASISHALSTYSPEQLQAWFADPANRNEEGIRLPGGDRRIRENLVPDFMRRFRFLNESGDIGVNRTDAERYRLAANVGVPAQRMFEHLRGQGVTMPEDQLRSILEQYVSSDAAGGRVIRDQNPSLNLDTVYNNLRANNFAAMPAAGIGSAYGSATSIAPINLTNNAARMMQAVLAANPNINMSQAELGRTIQSYASASNEEGIRIRENFEGRTGISLIDLWRRHIEGNTPIPAVAPNTFVPSAANTVWGPPRPNLTPPTPDAALAIPGLGSASAALTPPAGPGFTPITPPVLPAPLPLIVAPINPGLGVPPPANIVPPIVAPTAPAGLGVPANLAPPPAVAPYSGVSSGTVTARADGGFDVTGTRVAYPTGSDALAIMARGRADDIAALVAQNAIMRHLGATSATFQGFGVTSQNTANGQRTYGFSGRVSSVNGQPFTPAPQMPEQLNMPTQIPRPTAQGALLMPGALGAGLNAALQATQGEMASGPMIGQVAHEFPPIVEQLGPSTLLPQPSTQGSISLPGTLGAGLNAALQTNPGIIQTTPLVDRAAIGMGINELQTSLVNNRPAVMDRAAIDAALQTTYGMGLDEMQILIRSFRELAGQGVPQAQGAMLSPGTLSATLSGLGRIQPPNGATLLPNTLDGIIQRPTLLPNIPGGPTPLGPTPLGLAPGFTGQASDFAVGSPLFNTLSTAFQERFSNLAIEGQSIPEGYITPTTMREMFNDQGEDRQNEWLRTAFPTLPGAIPPNITTPPTAPAISAVLPRPIDPEDRIRQQKITETADNTASIASDAEEIASSTDLTADNTANTNKLMDKVVKLLAAISTKLSGRSNGTNNNMDAPFLDAQLNVDWAEQFNDSQAMEANSV